MLWKQERSCPLGLICWLGIMGMGVRTFVGGARSWDEQTDNFDVDPKLLLQPVLLVSRPAHASRRQSLCPEPDSSPLSLPAPLPMSSTARPFVTPAPGFNVSSFEGATVVVPVVR